NVAGQLGNNSVVDSTTPVQASGLGGVVAVAASGYHSLALRADGTARAWGLNDRGQLGDGTTTNRKVPVVVKGASGVVALSAGEKHSLGLRSDGTVWAWGANDKGQLGSGASCASCATPVPSAVG